MSKIIVHNLHKRFKNKVVLSGIDFQVENEIIFIAGLNGAGKTTLLRIMLEMEKPDKGETRFENTCETNKEQVACVFDSTCLYLNMTTRQNINIFCTGYLNDKDHMEEVIDNLQIRGFLDKKVGNCSFGQQHRISIAIALIRKPVFLLLDEPTIGIDPISWELVRKSIILNREKTQGCVIITGQDYDELCEMSHKLVVLHKGEMVYYGTPEEFLARQNQENKELSYKDAFLMLYNRGE